MIKFWKILIVGLASAALTWAALAVALEVPKLQGRVNDYAGLLDAAQRERLERRLQAYEKSSGNQFVLLTVRSLEGDALEDFSIRVAEAWQPGSEKEDTGLIMLVAAEDRKMRIEVGYGLEGNIPDAIAARVTRNVLAPAFRKGDYYGGINAGFSALMKAASGEAVPEISGGGGRVRTERAPSSPWVTGFSLLFTLLLLGSSWLSPRGRRRGFFYGGMGGFGGGMGGGGFGGGGGFSGGGGGFGGGGASGNW